MADFAIGISKAAVEALVNKVKSAIKEEAERWQTVERDLVFITSEFEMMQAFLESASEGRVSVMMNNVIARTWVRQVRDLSYDVEDCIEFVLHLDAKKKSSWWLRLRPSCGKAGAMLPVDEAVAEIALLKARVVDVSQRNIRYNLFVSDDSVGSKPIATQLQPIAAAASTRAFDITVNNAKAKECGLSDLVGLITREGSKDLQVISVCGEEGDLGRTSIIRQAYSDSASGFVCRAWVKLSHPFNPLYFAQNMLAQFNTDSSHHKQQQDGAAGLQILTRIQAASGDLVMEEFIHKVSTHRFLIVLEDLSSMAQWDSVRPYLPDRETGSRVVVLTHQAVIATLCTGEPYQVSAIKQFSPHQHSIFVYFKEDLHYDRAHSFIKDEINNQMCDYALLGRQMEVDNLFEKIQKHSCFSIWGMPGVGKSTLVRAIYDKYKTLNQFKTLWVNVFHYFNPMDFCQSLLLAFRESTSPEEPSSSAAQPKDPIKECQYLLRKNVFLLVIDGLRSKEDWDWIMDNLVKRVDSRSRIITITSGESIAKHCAVAIDAVYNVKGLEPQVAFQLFKEVLQNCNCTLLTWVESDAKELVMSKCGGLPKVIHSLATWHATRRDIKVDWFTETSRLTSNFMGEVEKNSEFGAIREIVAWMHSYFDACPRHLKACILYLSIFPQGMIICRRRLVRRWIAEGYSKGTDTNSLEKYAEKLLEELAALGIMMRPVRKTNLVTGYQLNGFFHEYILSRPAEERIFFPLEVSVLDDVNGGPTTLGLGQHLAIGGHWKEDRAVFESLDLSRLRSLTLFGKFSPFYVSADRMRVLRVLDLENAEDVSLEKLREIGKLPPRLKFLSLRGHRGIKCLPDSVGDLTQLQTLDIRGTSILDLPPWITRLQKLQHIRAGNSVPCPDPDDDGSTGGIVVPEGIRGMKGLLTLGDVDISGGGGLSELKYLQQLRKLQLSGIKRRHIEELGRVLWDSKHLESLSLHFDDTTHNLDFKLPYSLRSLKLHGADNDIQDLCQGNLGSLHNLIKLSVEMITSSTECLNREIQGLKNLRDLRLRVNNRQDGHHGNLHFDENGFYGLQYLEITCKSTLDLIFGRRGMQKLELLKLVNRSTSKPSMEFSGLEYQTSLSQVWLEGSFDDQMTETLQRILLRHLKKPALKLVQGERLVEPFTEDGLRRIEMSGSHDEEDITEIV